MTLKIALLGCGRIAQRHAELLGQDHIQGATLVSVCDIKKEKAEALANQYQVPFYTDMHDMMKNESIDVVSVLTESGHHARDVLALARYQKHLIVEKPMALTVADADTMIQACQNHQIQLFVVKQNRFNVPVIQLRKALEQKRFGRLLMGTVRVRWCRTQAYYDQDPWRGTWKLDGGVLTNQASHHIDLLEWMMGDVDKVFAKSKHSLAEIEAEDTAVVVMSFKNGALGVIEATTAVRPKDLEGSISILGETGTVEIAGFAVNELKTWNFSNSGPEDENVLQRYSVNPPNVYGFGHKAYYDHVVSCLVEKKRPLVDGQEGKKSVELINAIYQSIETGQEVSLEKRPHVSLLGA